MSTRDTLSLSSQAAIAADQGRRRVLGAAMMAAPVSLLLNAASSTAQAQPAAGQQKSALVTGSSRGIGAAIAQRLAQDGYAVTLNYLNNRDLAARLVEKITEAGGQAHYVQADVSDPVAVKRLFKETHDAFGGIDVVVSNAGIMRLAPFALMKDEDFDRMMAVNIKGSFNVLREAAQQVRDGGRILTLSSSITKLRSPMYGPYAASKSAQELFANVLAKELAGRNISVNAIAPGLVNTTLFTDGKTAEQIAGFAQRTPHKRLAEPEDIADIVSALCSQDGWWVNGQTVFANGGII